ncbi:glycosyltransferase [Butyrivibrio sp. AE2032]|uniref:glycosyltransferase n=1 Tax=Butyrivibrio sp. AE2032 TaxID=1458463 RepID=UPI00068BC9B5|nr:glycosyltransferase [Butyrivibrio sp. AE2032]
MQYNVCVVMSTYNGEKYLATQIDSLLQQEGVNLLLYIRDDGSSDNTPCILKEYSESHDNIVISIENNIGFRKSFLKALKDAPDCDYYGFCDQDDYWYPNKLFDTLSLLRKSQASLAFGNAIVTDEKLEGDSLLYSEIRVPSFPESLTASNTHGFLFCFDKRLRDLAIRLSVDLFNIPHDFWLVTLASLFGSISYDNNMVVAKYRRLPNSVSRYRPILLLLKRIEALFVDRGIVVQYSKYILKFYSDVLTPENRRLVTACAYYKEDKKSKKYLLNSKYIKKKYKIKVILNRL